MVKPGEKWNDNSIQFPRLLAELFGIGLTARQYQQLRDAMDLEVEDIDELLERALMTWDRIKEEHRHG